MMTGNSETLATIWEAPDHLWERIHPVILEMDSPKATGRKRVHPRRILDAIIFRMRTGCHWNRLPLELGHDIKLLDMTLDGIVVERPETGAWHLCLNKGYDNPTGHEAVAAHEYRSTSGG